MAGGMRTIRAIILALVLATCGMAAAGQTKRVTVEDHDSLTVYYPHFKKIDFITETMPGKGETDVIFVCAASFTGHGLSDEVNLLEMGIIHRQAVVVLDGDALRH